MEETLEAAEENLQRARSLDAAEDGDDDNGLPGGLPTEGATEGTRAVVADKRYNRAVLLRRLKEKEYSSYIPERRQGGKRRWTNSGICSVKAHRGAWRSPRAPTCLPLGVAPAVG
jgi:hypothetical protein